MSQSALHHDYFTKPLALTEYEKTLKCEALSTANVATENCYHRTDIAAKSLRAVSKLRRWSQVCYAITPQYYI